MNFLDSLCSSSIKRLGSILSANQHSVWYLYLGVCVFKEDKGSINQWVTMQLYTCVLISKPNWVQWYPRQYNGTPDSSSQQGCMDWAALISCLPNEVQHCHLPRGEAEGQGSRSLAWGTQWSPVTAPFIKSVFLQGAFAFAEKGWPWKFSGNAKRTTLGLINTGCVHTTSLKFT